MKFGFMNIIRKLFEIFWAPALVLALQYCRQWFYYGHSEIDPIAHFMGGFTIAYGALIAFRWIYPKLRLPTLIQAYILVMAGMGTGLIWEWYEWVRFFGNPAFAHWDWWSDTLYDLLMDTLGAGFFTCLATMRKKI